MITRNLIDLPNHPVLGIPRKAKALESNMKYESNRIVLSVKVFHYDTNGNELKYDIGAENGVVYLTADNTVRVDPANGSIVVNAPKNPDGTYTSATVGEYDFLWNIANVLKLKTIPELEDSYILMRSDKINEKLYGA